MSRKGSGRFVLGSVLAILVAAATGVRAQDPGLVLYLDFEELQPYFRDEWPQGLEWWMTRDRSIYRDTYIFASPPGSLGLVPGAHGQALKASAFVQSGQSPWVDDRVPVDGVSVLMWGQIENRQGSASLLALSTELRSVLAASLTANDRNVFVAARGHDWVLFDDAERPAFKIHQGDGRADKWIHFAGVYDRSQGMATLYIDGEKLRAAPYGGPIVGDWGSKDGSWKGGVLAQLAPRDGASAVLIDDLNV
jgi:hypothetical protein